MGMLGGGGGRWSQDKPRIIPGLPVLLRCSGILCHIEEHGEAVPRTAGVTLVFWDTRMKLRQG